MLGGCSKERKNTNNIRADLDWGQGLCDTPPSLVVPHVTVGFCPSYNAAMGSLGGYSLPQAAPPKGFAQGCPSYFK